MSTWPVFIDVSEIIDIVTSDELIEYVEDVIEETTIEVFTTLTAPPSQGGTPVLTGEARNSIQIDMSNKLAPEIYSTAPHMPALNDGSSKQQKAGFWEAAMDKATHD